MASSRGCLTGTFVSLLLVQFLRPVASQDDYVIASGDVMFATLLPVNDLENGLCGQYEQETMQSIVGVTWFLEALNRMDYIPGVTLGLDVYRTCKKPELATEGAIKLLNKYGVMDHTSQSNGTVLFGILGPERTSETLPVSSLLSSLPTNQRVMQISGSSTGQQLSDSTRFPNFFRVIPPDETQVKVMLELLIQLQWNYVAIVYDDDDYGQSAATQLRQLAEERQLCIPVFASLPIDTKLSTFTIKATEIANQLKNAENGLVRGVVILGGPSTTDALLKALSQQVSYVTLVLSEAVALQRATLLTSGGQVTPLARGTMVTTPPYVDIPEVTTRWNQVWTNQSAFLEHVSTNPWLEEYFRQVTGCLLSSPDCWDQTLSQRTSQLAAKGNELSLYISYQVKATAAMAALLKRLHDATCGATSLRGVCRQLRQKLDERQDILDELRRTASDPQAALDLSVFAPVSAFFSALTSVAFNATTGDILNGGSEKVYTVYNFRQDDQGDFSFVQIGTWEDDTLTINTTQAQFYNESNQPLTWSQLPPAQCPSNHDCLKCVRDVSQDVIFVEGDFYVIGMAPASDKSPEDVLACGPVKALVGADIAQALVFAVEQINAKSGMFRTILPGRRVGLLVINTCGSPLLLKKRLMDIHAGAVPLPGNRNRNSSSFLGNVMGYVGPYFSANSIAAAETLNGLGRPFVQVNGASTSPALSDREKYPYFLRLSAPDVKQAQALLDVVDSLGADYIQVLYDASTTYATGLFHELESQVRSPDSRYNICIAQSIATTPKPDVSQYFWIRNTLRQKNTARVVIVLLHHLEITKVMDAILPSLELGEFLFVASESWGRRLELIEGQHSIKLAGSLVLSQEIVIDQLFQLYFQNLQPDSSLNPWLASFWENRLSCFLNKSFKRAGRTAGRCPEDFAQSYVQDVRIPFHINAVYALALGFNRTLARVCGDLAGRVCQGLTSSDLWEEMVQVEMDLYGTGHVGPVFDSKGDGLVGYKVLQVERDRVSSSSPEVVKYADVGSWSLNRLTLETDTLVLATDPNFQSLCHAELSDCQRCFQPPTPSNESGAGELCVGEKAVSAGLFAGLVVVLVVIVVVLAVVLGVILYRQRAAVSKEEASEVKRKTTNHRHHQHPQQLQLDDLQIRMHSLDTDSSFPTPDHYSSLSHSSQYSTITDEQAARPAMTLPPQPHIASTPPPSPSPSPTPAPTPTPSPPPPPPRPCETSASAGYIHAIPSESDLDIGT